MHTHSLEPWSHGHVFLGDRHDRHARRTWAVVALTAVTMVVEIAGGTWFGSMALVADGWHMSTHAAALGIAALAYRFARRHAEDPRFTFGTGKFGDLAAFASAIILGLVALLIGAESVDRLLHPAPIGFGQAIPIAILGLAVNLASVWLLHDDHDDHGHHGHAHGGHSHGGHGGHGHGGHGHDTNFRAAYIHVLADALTSVLAIAALAYHFARRHADDPRFSFGTGKFGDLAAFASAIILGLIALLIGAESLDRLLHPVAIGFGPAIPIAVLGLAVNVASVWLLHDDHGHNDHGHGHGGHGHSHGGHGHGGHDTNFRAAYVHVLADALTSVLAIAALLGGRYLGLAWLDPAMGLVGTAVILAWSWSLLRTAGLVLLDARPSAAATREIRERLESGGDRISDLHLWQVGPGHRAAVIALVSDDPQPPAHYKARLAGVRGLSHVTVEVQPCPGHAAA